MRVQIQQAILASVIAVVFGSIGALAFLLLHGASKAEVWLPAFAAFAAAFAAPYVAEWIKAHWFVAKLEIDCEPGVPYYVQTFATSSQRSWFESVQDWVMHAYRLKLTNVGFAQADDCEVILERVWVQRDKEWCELAFWQPLSLHFAHDNANEPRHSLNRKRSVFVDVGFVGLENVERQHPAGAWPGIQGPAFVLSTLNHPNSQPGKLAAGRYCLQTSAYSATGLAATAFLDLQFRLDENTYEFVRIAAMLGESDSLGGVGLRKVPTAPTAKRKLMGVSELHDFNALLRESMEEAR